MRLMSKRIGGCTVQGRGLYRWYKGKTRWVCPYTEDVEAVENAWTAVRKQIDAGENARPACLSTLRELISSFVTAAERRVLTGKPKPLSPRMLHNYVVDLNQFGKIVGGGVKVADIGPPHFASYVAKIAHMKSSGFDSKIAHVMSMFQFAVRNEYIDRVRYGDAFSRPGKQAIRDERIVKTFSYTVAEVAKLLNASTGTMRVMLYLGMAGALNNSEIAWLERSCVDLDAGTVDFRRRKSGRVRRVIPLPVEVVELLRGYQRPDPLEPVHDDLFFLTTAGKPYVRMTENAQANTISVLFRDLAIACGLKSKVKGSSDGRGFKGLRTTWTNLAPPGYREEVEIITGHARGTMLLDHYLESVGLDRLRHVSAYVWNQISTSLLDESRSATPADPPAAPL